MASTPKYIKGGIQIQCNTSLFPAPRPRSLFAVPAFHDACASLITPTLVAILDSGAAGINVVSTGPLPGATTASWTLYDQCWQGDTPENLPIPLAYPVVLNATNSLNYTISYPLANATHTLWLVRIEAGKTFTYPSSSLTTPIDTTQSNLTTLLKQIDALDNNNILSPSQKAQVITDYNGLMGQITYLRTEATSAGVTTFPTQTTLPSYLTGLGTSPTPTSVTLAGVPTPSYAWNDTANQTVVPSRINWDNAWSSATTEEAGLQAAILAITNSIATQAGSDASAALAAANAANTAALQAENDIANISSDNILSKAEKTKVIIDVNAILSEQLGTTIPTFISTPEGGLLEQLAYIVSPTGSASPINGLDSQALAWNLIADKNAYDTAISNLLTYLSTAYNPTTKQGVGTGSKDWGTITSDSVIDGSTFRGIFYSVYQAQQKLLNDIYTSAQNAAIGSLGNGANYCPNGDSEMGPILGTPGDSVFDTSLTYPGGLTFPSGYLGSRYVRALNIGGSGWGARMPGTLSTFGLVPGASNLNISSSDAYSFTFPPGPGVALTLPGKIKATIGDTFYISAKIKRLTGAPVIGSPGPGGFPMAADQDLCYLIVYWLDATNNPVIDHWPSANFSGVYLNALVQTNTVADGWVQVGGIQNTEIFPVPDPSTFAANGFAGAYLSAPVASIMVAAYATGGSQWYIDDITILKNTVIPATTSAIGAVSVPDSSVSALKVSPMGALSLDTTSSAFVAAVQSVGGGTGTGSGGGYAPLTIASGTTFTIPANSQCAYVQPIHNSGTIQIVGNGILFGVK